MQEERQTKKKGPTLGIAKEGPRSTSRYAALWWQVQGAHTAQMGEDLSAQCMQYITEYMQFDVTDLRAPCVISKELSLLEAPCFSLHYSAHTHTQQRTNSRPTRCTADTLSR